VAYENVKPTYLPKLKEEVKVVMLREEGYHSDAAEDEGLI